MINNGDEAGAAMGRLTMTGPRVGLAEPRVKPPVKLADPFYETKAWRDFAGAIKRQRGYACEACGADGRGREWTIHADHIVERKDGGADFDPLNVRLLCQPCHNRKTAGAKAARLAG